MISKSFFIVVFVLFSMPNNAEASSRDVLSVFTALAGEYAGQPKPPCGSPKFSFPSQTEIGELTGSPGAFGAAYDQDNSCRILLASGIWNQQGLEFTCLVIVHEVLHLYGYSHGQTNVMLGAYGDPCPRVLMTVRVCKRITGGSECYGVIRLKPSALQLMTKTKRPNWIKKSNRR